MGNPQTSLDSTSTNNATLKRFPWMKNNDSASSTKATPNRFMSIWKGTYHFIVSRVLASLILIGPIIPIVVSLITVLIYLSLPSSIFPLNTLFPLYTLLISCVITGILWFLASIPISTVCTAQTANPRNFGLLQNRLHQLEVSLGLKGDDNGADQEFQSLNTLLESVDCKKMNKHQQEVVKEAYTSCCDIEQLIYKSPSGLPWILGSGYNTAWSLLHHAEEAMIEVMEVETVVRGAKHDFMSIQGSQINGKDGLLDDIIHAVQVLKPEALIYFQENLSRKSSLDRLQIIQPANKTGASPPTSHATDKKPSDQQEQVQHVADARVALREAKGTLNKPGTSPPTSKVLPMILGMVRQTLNKPGTSPPTSNATDENPLDQQEQDQQKAHARMALREVKGTLNDYRDKRWEGLVRQRSHLLKTIAVTGLVTFIFLTVMILGFPFININSNSYIAFQNNQKDLLAATIIYMVGALAGLFVRFYAESQNETSIDDFGLSTTRLIAIPLLSGLAAVGGVVITELLGSIENSLGFPDLFNLQQPKVLFIAVIFGAAPNLFIRGLQKQANDYEAEIQSSKAAETVK